jgi:uncharacterized protein (TIGR01777 family)
MRVAVTGATGLIGQALLPVLAEAGHEVCRVVRGAAAGPGEIGWDPAAGRLDPADLAGVTGVVHLAGESIAGFWTRSRRERIYRSRIAGTRLVARALAAAPEPRVLVCASAIGYYGDRGDAVLTEESGPGTGFLARVCEDWEAEAGRATEAGARVVSVRLGVIQSGRAGMLKSMVGPARLGPVVRFGAGRRYLSWVGLVDVVRAIRFALETAELSGPVNVTAPHPVTNAEYAGRLGRLLHRPVLPVPPPLLRLALPGAADELLLQSARVEPARLTVAGFTFTHPTLAEALRAELPEAPGG